MIRYLGHAILYMKTDKVSIVTDPWFSKTGAYESNWFQYPDNTDIDFDWVDGLDYVCISHEHDDHCDIEFLKKLNHSTKIVTANFINKRYLNLLKDNLVNEIIEVDDRTTFKMGDIKYTPMIQIPMGQEDSAMIFEMGDDVILNFNDMKPSQKDLDWIKKKYDVTYLLKQYSGASWYPLVYDYDDDKMYELCKDKRLFKYQVILNTIEELNPKFYIPFAGPPCFLQSDTYHINFLVENTFPSEADIYNFFKENHSKVSEKFIVLMPGDLVGEDWKHNLQHKCFTDKVGYLKEYKDRREDIIKEASNRIKKVDYSLLKKSIKYFYPLMRSASRLCENIGGSVLFNISGDYEEKIILDFVNSKVRLLNDDAYFYEFDIKGKWLNHILKKQMTWEEFFLTLNFKARRKPDMYNEHLMAFLKLADPVSYKEYEDFHFDELETEMFDLKFSGNDYKCQKYCPHARGDMSKGKIIDGKIVCPTHNWKFNLPDGQCSTNKSKLIIEEV